MLDFLEYQTLWFNKKPICGKCDVPIFPSNKDLYLQYIASVLPANAFPNGNYDTNPFNAITSTTFTFNVSFSSPNINDYFTLYIADKVYIFGFTVEPPTILNPYQVATVGNVTHIQIIFAGGTTGFSNKLIQVFNNIIDVNHSTTTTRSGTNFTVSFMPSGSYIDDINFNFLSSVSTITPQISSLKLVNGYYNSTTKQINYYFIQKNSVANKQFSLKENVALTTAKNYRIKYGYATVFAFDHTINIRNAANIIVFTKNTNPLIVSYSGLNLTEQYLCASTEIYTFEFLFNPENDNAQLAFDNVYVQEVCGISDIKLIAENGLNSDINLDFNVEFVVVNGVTIIKFIINSILTPLDDADIDWRTFCMRLKITDCDANIYYSNYFGFVDMNNIPCQFKKTRLTWYHRCQFNGLQYPSGVQYDMFVTGYADRITGDNKGREIFEDSTGRLSTVFNYSVKKYNLKIVNYTFLLHEVIEKAVEHSHFQIDGERFTLEEGSSYDFGRGNNARKTASIDLVKVGSEVININCCPT